MALKSLNRIFLDRLIKFDKEYFKDYDEPKSESEISRWLAEWAHNNNIQFNKAGWKMIYAIRAAWPEIWFQTFELIFDEKYSI